MAFVDVLRIEKSRRQSNHGKSGVRWSFQNLEIKLRFEPLKKFNSKNLPTVAIRIKLSKTAFCSFIFLPFEHSNHSHVQNRSISRLIATNMTHRGSLLLCGVFASRESYFYTSICMRRCRQGFSQFVSLFPGLSHRAIPPFAREHLKL